MSAGDLTTTPTTGFEYYCLVFEKITDLSVVNAAARGGWRLLLIVPEEKRYAAIMERALPGVTG
jgi:hypothetical protein